MPFQADQIHSGERAMNGVAAGVVPGGGNRLQERLVLPVMEETLHVSRRVVETGRAVRVRKLVNEVSVNVDEPLTSEFVDTERVAIGRILRAPVGIRHEGDVMIVPIIEERLVVHKELVLVEEIRITRRREIRKAPQQVTVRREVAVVERFDPDTQQWNAAEEDQVQSGDASVPGPPGRP